MATNKSKQANNETIVIGLIVAVLVGWIVGFAVGNSLAKSDASKTDSMESTSEMAEYDGETTVKIKAQKDTMGGYNVQIITTGFEFTPENAGLENVEGQGHAHVYVDGEKVGRAYGEWYHIPELEMGEHTIKVSLNSNDHTPITVDGQEVQATVVVTEDGHTDHTH